MEERVLTSFSLLTLLEGSAAELSPSSSEVEISLMMDEDIELIFDLDLAEDEDHWYPGTDPVATGIRYMDPLINLERIQGVIPLFRGLLSSFINWTDESQRLEPLHRVDDVIQLITEGLKHPAGSSTTMFVYSNLKSIEKDMLYIREAQWHIKGREDTVCFLNYLLQILQHVYDSLENIFDTFIPANREMSYVCDELKFIETMFRLINSNGLAVSDKRNSNMSRSTAELAVEMSFVLYHRLLNKMDDAGMLVTPLRMATYALRQLLRNYYRFEYRLMCLTQIVDSCKLDGRVAGCFDYLIEEMRKLLFNDGDSSMVPADLDVIEMLVEELTLLRYHLLDIITLYLQEEEVGVKEEMRSLIVSTQILIMDTGFYIYFSSFDARGKTEKESALDFAHNFSLSGEELALQAFFSRAAAHFPKGQAERYLSETDRDDGNETVNYWRFNFPGLLEEVESLKQQASDLFGVCSQLFSLSERSHGSKNQTESCTDFLTSNLEKLMHSDVASIVSHKIRTVYQETLWLRTSIADDHLAKAEFLGRLLEESANKSSSIICYLLAGVGTLWYKKLGIFLVHTYIRVVQTAVKAFSKRMVVSHTVSHSIPRPASSAEKSSVSNVDFQDKLKLEECVHRDSATDVINLLTSIRATPLKIVSIVGMPGLGKTTLANTVYTHPSISEYFHLRAWCCASQYYVKEVLLLEILSQIRGKTCAEGNGEDVALKLYQNLKGRKYLIVIDDVHDANLWDDLRETFPDDRNGSKVLFTTRNRVVSLETNSVSYPLRLLFCEESYQLLVHKVFGREPCPSELSVLASRIARNCKGLPLAVVLIAGILIRTERRKDSWERVAQTVFRSHREHATPSDTMDFTSILELSVNHLPGNLKPCFYYFGAFMEDTSISVSKLLRLWISEGFLQVCENKSLKQVAEQCLQDLIDRSLVMIAKTSSRGGVKACRVHNVLHEFCSRKLFADRKVLKGGFLYSNPSHHYNLDWHPTTYLYHYQPCPSTAISDDHFYSPDGSKGLFSGPCSERYVFRNAPSIPTDRHSEGALVIGTRTSQRKRFKYEFIFKVLFLTVLDLGNVRVECSADIKDIIIISKLLHLRYLEIRPRRNEIPTEIGNLQMLETFAVTGVIGNIMLPQSVWNLVHLRNLLSEHGIFNFPHPSQDSFKTFFQLDNLRSISTLPIRRGNNVDEYILPRLSRIEKLGCIFFADSWDDDKSCTIFPQLGFLAELKSLKIFFSGNVRHPCKFDFPLNLTKLSLTNLCLPWKTISIIGQLPNLEVLKLLSKAFEGQHWDMVSGEFLNLKFLKLESLNIQEWSASAPDHLPSLQQLVVLHCPRLKEIPSSLGEIATLKFIEMKWCSPSAMDSAKNIGEIQRDMSNDDLVLSLTSA